MSHYSSFLQKTILQYLPKERLLSSCSLEWSRNPSAHQLGDGGGKFPHRAPLLPTDPVNIHRLLNVYTHGVLGGMHKGLAYVEYKAVSDVFQGILTPQPPLQPASGPFPHTKGRGYTLAGRWGGWGVYIFWKTPVIVLTSYSKILLRLDVNTDCMYHLPTVIPDGHSYFSIGI